MHSIDPLKKFKIKFSPSKFLRSFSLVFAIAIGGGIATFVPGVKDAGVERFVGVIILEFFGFGSGFLIWRGIRSAGTIITLSPECICHAWFSKQTIPWPAIHSIEVRNAGFRQIILLHLDPTFEQELSRHPMARWIRRAPIRDAKALGVEAYKLDIEPDDLAGMFRRYARTHGGNR